MRSLASFQTIMNKSLWLGLITVRATPTSYQPLKIQIFPLKMALNQKLKMFFTPISPVLIQLFISFNPQTLFK